METKTTLRLPARDAAIERGNNQRHETLVICCFEISLLGYSSRYPLARQVTCKKPKPEKERGRHASFWDARCGGTRQGEVKICSTALERKRGGGIVERSDTGAVHR